ncbi:MAG TPA: Fe-S cluster assembly protein SufD [Deltaproteobacteria bacterium]|nr:Fe-S cluster assembly protein SufD [Deltaproteobacteria bacterium]
MSRAIDSLRALRPPDDEGWIGRLREEAFARFEEQGIPSRRLEAWRGTSLARLEAMDFGRVGPDRSGRTGTAETTARTDDGTDSSTPALVFIDGRFDEAASRASGKSIEWPRGLRVLTLAEAIEGEPGLLEGRLARLADPKRHPLVALQTAFLEDGAVVMIEAGTSIATPIRLRFVSTGEPAAEVPVERATGSGDVVDVDASREPRASARFPRLLVVAEAGSDASLWIEHVSTGTAPGFTAFISEIHLADGARVEYLETQEGDPEWIHFTSTHARLERGAHFDAHVFSLGTNLVRSELEIELAEPDAETTLCGLLLGREAGHIDHYTTVDHAAKRCRSEEEYRGILGDRSEGVFRGRVIVRPGAARTDARQSNPNILLSDHASIDTKPQLEIYADDIRASHGATIGQLDPDAVFFLRARGLGPDQARLLLTKAFANAIVLRIANESLRDEVGSRVSDTLAHFSPSTEAGGAEG